MSRRKGYSTFQRRGRGPWYVAWNDGTGVRRVRKVGDSKRTAEEVGRAKAAEADKVRLGLVSPGDVKARHAAGMPVAKHIEAWKKAILESGRTTKYAELESQRVTALCETATIARLTDLTPEAIATGLASVAESASPQSANHYRTAIRMFARWCVRTGRLKENPAQGVPRLSAPGDTFRRHAFTPEQLDALLKATETRDSAAEFKGVDRAMFYRVMAYTGLRKSEACSLTPESFEFPDLKMCDCTVTVEAAYSKHRRRDVIPLREDFAQIVFQWVRRKPEGQRLFTLPANWQRLFLKDCAAAGIVPAEGSPHRLSNRRPEHD